MKVRELVEKSNGIKNTQTNPTAIEKYIKNNIEFKHYVPLVEKRELCANVLEACCTKNGAIIEVDSVSRYILFTLSVIKKYTNLEFENTDDLDAVDQYDMLCQSGLLNYILGAIGGEYESCNNILNMMMADIDVNNNNVAVVVDKALQRVLGYVDKLTETLKNKVEGLSLDLSQLDIDKIMGVIDKFPKK